MKEERVVRFAQRAGIMLFYAFVAGVIIFLANGIRNGWEYRASSGHYELSFPFALIISLVIITVFSVLTFVVSLVFWGIMRPEEEGGDS